LSLVVDIEAANKEEESKMKYKMHRIDKLKFRADALIQEGLGELELRLLFETLLRLSFSLKAFLRLSERLFLTLLSLS